jgi:hypothetical protein
LTGVTARIDEQPVERCSFLIRHFEHVCTLSSFTLAEEPTTAICSVVPIGNHKVAFPNLEMTESTAGASAAAPGQEFR